MRIIFLDIDGVLNTTGDKDLINNTFEVTKLERLIKLSNETNSHIVIISDRRLLETERISIDYVFKTYNKKVFYLSLKRTHRKRSDEVSYYIDNNKVENYVILDDNDLGYLSNKALSSHYINTYSEGFSSNLYNEAYNLLVK